MEIAWGFVFNAFIGILAILNPVGNVAVFLENVSGEKPKMQRMMALLMGAAVFIIMLAFFLLGSSILRVFGISMPAFRLAGSILVFIVGFRMMNGKSKYSSEGIETAYEGGIFAAAKRKVSKIIIPVAMPIFVGPGTITAVVLYAGQTEGFTYFAVMGAVLLCALIMTACLYFSSYIKNILGQNGMQVIVRFMGLILCAVGAQFFIDAAATLAPGFINNGF